MARKCGPSSWAQSPQRKAIHFYITFSRVESSPGWPAFAGHDTTQTQKRAGATGTPPETPALALKLHSRPAEGRFRPTTGTFAPTASVPAKSAKRAPPWARAGIGVSRGCARGHIRTCMASRRLRIGTFRRPRNNTNIGSFSNNRLSKYGDRTHRC